MVVFARTCVRPLACAAGVVDGLLASRTAPAQFAHLSACRGRLRSGEYHAGRCTATGRVRCMFGRCFEGINATAGSWESGRRASDERTSVLSRIAEAAMSTSGFPIS